MDILKKIEQEKGICLPEIYKEFYRSYSVSMPENLIGTDLVHKHSQLDEWAIELLEENGIPNFLEPGDFVFMMHQGYIFWYFKADGNPDPIVYSYHEADKKKKKLGRFSEFIKLYN